MITVSKRRLEYATEVFLSSMRHAAVNSGSQTQIGTLNSYAPAQRSALMESVSKSIAAVQPENERGFEAWRDRNGG